MRISTYGRGLVLAATMAASVSSAIRLPGDAGLVLLAQQTIPPPKTPRSPFEGPAPAPSGIERLGPDRLRIGTIVIDTARKEFSVSGFVNEVVVLEFLANTKGGWKAYESALELDTNAVNFNVACILIGLDNTRAVPPRKQFDEEAPKGDPVEIFIEWDGPSGRRRIRAEDLIYNRVTKRTLDIGPWVYTGSVFVREGNRYLAETEGTLIGFMHTPAPIIESPRALQARYGTDIINPELGLKPGTQVVVTVRAMPR